MTPRSRRTPPAAVAHLIVPASAYAECLVAPSGRGPDAIRLVDEFLDALPVSVEPLSRRIGTVAAGLRSRHGRPGRGRRALRLPDALVLATALALDGDLVITTDAGWPSNIVPLEIVSSAHGRDTRGTTGGYSSEMLSRRRGVRPVRRPRVERGAGGRSSRSIQ